MSHYNKQREEEQKRIAADELALIKERAKIAKLNEGKS